MNKQYGNIDILKICMCVLVTLLHLRPFYDISSKMDFILTFSLTRIAVPCFFCCSGFLFYCKGRRYRRYVLRMIFTYCAWTVLYMPQIIIGFFDEKYSNYGMAEKMLIFIRRFFLVASWTQLWFFIASAYAMFIIWFLSKLIKLETIFIFAMITSVLCACINDCYIWITTRLVPNSNRLFVFFETIKPWTGTIFGGVVFGVMYISLGMIMAKRIKSKTNEQLKGLSKVILLVMLFIISLMLLTMESKVDFVNGARELSKMICLLPATALILMIAVATKQKYLSEKWQYVLRSFSTLIYGFHGIISFFIVKNGMNSIQYYFVVMILTIFLSVLVLELNKTKVHMIIRWLL